MTIKLLSRDFAFYGLLDFVQRSLSILLVPIYTRVLSQTDYGNLDLILTVISGLTVLIDLQFVAGFSRLYLETKRGGHGPRLVGTAIMTRVTLGAIVAAVFLLLGYGGFLDVKFLPPFAPHRTAWIIAALTIPVTFAFDILLVQAQMLRWKKTFFAGAVGNTLLLTGLSVVFTLVVPLGIVGVVLAQFLGKLVATCMLFVGLRSEVAFRHDGRLLREIAGYSLPLVPGRWMGHFDGYVSRFFIYAALGASENAILAITTKLAAAIGLFSVAFRTAWQPLAMSYIGEEGGERFYVRSLRLFIAGGIFSMFALAVLAKPILSFLAPPSYAIADLYLPMFLIGGILAELDVSLQLGNQIAKKTFWISFSAAVAFGINLLILIVLTSRLGIYAAGLAVLVSCTTKVVFTYFTAQRHHRIEYDRRALFVFAAAGTSLLVLSLARGAHVIAETIFYAATAILGLLFPWLTLPRAEREMLRAAAAAVVSRRLHGGTTPP